MKQRADELLVQKGLVRSRSQAADFIKRGKVKIDGKVVPKPGYLINAGQAIHIEPGPTYVSRAGEKLASVSEVLKLSFSGKTVLDVGSSTGGFTDFALQNGAKKVIAVDVGTDQLDPILRNNPKIELFEQTDIRDFKLPDQAIDIVVIDVSFISLTQILPSVLKLSSPGTQIVAMFKPQFEAGSDKKHKGVIKNDAMRRDIMKNFESWTAKSFVIEDKCDSKLAGAHGTQERFYLLKPLINLVH
jgi:23S rRNA (cytidine1920-2'-O)/16S rRNA (cytidine1409-2'-O)-methyltransferase